MAMSLADSHDLCRLAEGHELGGLADQLGNGGDETGNLTDDPGWNVMAIDDPGHNDPFTVPPPLGGEQRQDALASLPQGDAQESDDFGVPVQDRPVKGRTNRVVAGFLICAVVSAALAIAQLINHHAVPHAVVAFGVIIAAPPVVVMGFGGFWHDKLEKRDQSMLFSAGGVGLVAACVLLATIGLSPPSGG